MGTGSSRVGADGSLGSVWSQGKLTVASRAQVHGSVHAAGSVAAGTLIVSSSAVVGGSVEENATILPAHEYAWNINFVPSNTMVSLEPGQSRSIAPGAYAGVSVKAGATLSIRAGTYFFSSLYVAPQGTLALDTRRARERIASAAGRIKHAGNTS